MSVRLPPGHAGRMTMVPKPLRTGDVGKRVQSLDNFKEYEMHRDEIAEVRPPIAIDANHFDRLFALSSLTRGPMIKVCEYLREELDRAHVLPSEKLCPDIVSLGSQVEFRDEQTGKVQEIILVYPLDADITCRRVSVLTPVGAALLGLSVDQTISFHATTGEQRELTVLKVSRAG